MKITLASLFTSAWVLASLFRASPAVAQDAIGLGTSVSGTISSIGEVDWYSVTTDVLGDLVVTQTAWPGFIETRTEVYGPGDQTTPQPNSIEAAAPGTYYIKVYSANNGTSAEVYTFNATLTPAATGNDGDGGGNAASAAVATSIGAEVSDTIGPSSATAGVQDEDWYTVTTDVVGDLTVTQTAWPGFIETRISVFGPDDPTLAQSNTVYAAAPGTYYFRVWSANDGASSEVYTFHTSLEEASTGNDIDRGTNSPEGAIPIEIGATVTDTIAPSKETAGMQDEDWYVLTLESPGELNVTQTQWPGFIETRTAVFGPNSSSVEFANPASPGTYYVKVWSANEGSSIEPYAFTSEFIPGSGGDGTGGSGTGGGGATAGETGSGVAGDGTGTPAAAGAGTGDGHSTSGDSGGADTGIKESGGEVNEATPKSTAGAGNETDEGSSGADGTGASGDNDGDDDDDDDGSSEETTAAACGCTTVGRAGHGWGGIVLGLGLASALWRRRRPLEES